MTRRDLPERYPEVNGFEPGYEPTSPPPHDCTAAEEEIERLTALAATQTATAVSTANDNNVAIDPQRLSKAMRVSLDIYGWDLDAMAEEIAAEYDRLPERAA